jgi:hypothetical protein
MEKFTVSNDLKLLCVTAASFPDGIQKAFDDLKNVLPKNNRRTPYGISFQKQDGTIIYKAAVEEAFDGEAAQIGCELFVVQKGEYVGVTIADWKQKIETIGLVFEELLQHPHLDPDSQCIEIYKSQTELICMVKILS